MYHMYLTSSPKSYLPLICNNIFSPFLSVFLLPLGVFKLGARECSWILLGSILYSQVQWAGFDKLEGADDAIRQVLLLGYRSGFQVWDVEEADNVRDLVSRHDGPVSFLQMAPKPIASSRSDDKFADSRPLLVVCADGASSGNIQDTTNGSISNQHDSVNTNFVPTVVRFYSLRSQSYVHMLKFRSAVYSVRCSSRIVAISQASQVSLRV